MDWWIVALVLGNLAFMGWIIRIFAQYQTDKSKQRSEERLRFAERFGTGQELADFLDSRAGEKLVAALSDRPPDPRGRIMSAFSGGLILLFIGLGFLLLVWIEDFGHPDPFLIPGVILVLAGTAVLLSVAVSIRLLKAAPPPDRDTRP